MNKSAAIIALGIVGALSAIPGASAAAEVVTLENEASAFSIEFATWGLIFGVSILLLILSFAKFNTDLSAEFFGFSGFVLAGLCAFAVPYVVDSNMFMTAAALFFVVIQLLNALRILFDRIQIASGASGSAERRSQRRNELFGSRKY